MKKFLILAATVLMVGCEPSNETRTDEFKLPDYLSDCTITKLVDKNTAIFTVVRCPNSSTSTTYMNGRSSQTSVVIDGQKYVKAGK